MNSDPLYSKVIEALKRPLDGNTFQACAAALIGKAHPNLVPMPGGDDAGMDGAFGTPDGPFPLVCTVQSDVLGNFRKNMSTYLAKRTGPKCAAVATSQRLSNRRKRNLEAAAEKLGVKIVNIYDAAYFAEQLYRDSQWRLKLLGITGESPALSALPRVGRFAQPEFIIGRDDDLDWIRQVQGDAMLVGQPGSGKTYIHQHLATSGFCLFAVDDSSGRLADAIRAQQPSVIAVDDAHVNLPLVETLMRLRTELGAAYQIHVNCWPFHENQVQRALNIPSSRVRGLGPLRRPKVFELITRLGITGPDWLQELIISQSEGKPGLAVALAEFCKTEGVGRIWSGEAAAQELLGNPRLVADEKHRCVLAAFAVGGEAGMRFDQVSTAIGLPILDLRRVTTELASGGVIEEVAQDRLQVRPAAIRPVLVRDVFYGGARSLPILPLLQAADSPASTAVVLLGARQRGAEIDRFLLERYVVAANTDDVWEHFAWVDPQCANVILDKYREKASRAASGLLAHVPRRALHALLDAEEADPALQPGASEHPNQQICEWVFPLDQAPDTTIKRRLVLLDVLEDRLHQGRLGNGGSFTRALAEVLQATFDRTKQSPRSRREIRCIRGVASLPILEKIAGLWPRVRELSRHIPGTTARILFRQIENWCLPQRLALDGPLSDDALAKIRQHGRQMLQDILQMPQCNRAWRSWAAKISNWGELGLHIDVDPAFDALYADRDRPETWQEEERKRAAQLEEIGDALVNRPMDDVLDYLAGLRSEAIEVGHQRRDGFLWIVYRRIATMCQEPMGWLNALIASNAPSDFLCPFLDRLLADRKSDQEAALRRMLQCEAYQIPAINLILRLAAPDESLLSEAIDVLNKPGLAENLHFWGSVIPVDVMARLLAHPNRAVRAAAAMGEWQCEPARTIRPPLEVYWRVAVRDVGPNHYALKEIFENDHHLAFEWLESQLGSENHPHAFSPDAFNHACTVLVKDQRRDLLRRLTRDNYDDGLFDVLIGNDIDLFAEWLDHQNDEYVRLQPLDRNAGPRWEQMALLALDAGVSSEELADHCTAHWWAGSGPLSQQFLALIPAYEALANHPDPRLHAAGERGRRFFESQAKSELERERREERMGD
jgi:hypothetical protein